MIKSKNVFSTQRPEMHLYAPYLRKIVPRSMLQSDKNVGHSSGSVKKLYCGKKKQT